MYSVLDGWLPLYILDMLVEELLAADPPLAYTLPDTEMVKCCGACQRKHAPPSRDEKMTGASVKWARLVAADANVPCDHWISWECLEASCTGSGSVDDCVDEEVLVCPKCNALIGGYWAMDAAGHLL